MSSNVLCRYYMQGACAFGDKCRFSHNKEQDEPSQVCRYYLAGNCAYGDKCRYQHSKPGWSGKGQAASQSHPYSAPSGVPKPHTSTTTNSSMVKLPSGASEFGLVEGAAPNWDDYMTPDEMDEFDQWQAEQAIAASNRSGEGGQQQQDDEGDIMDPADIPLCNEFAATGGCSAGEECCYIHGDQCEICGYFCIHPYNPDITAHHQMVCSEAMAAAAGGGGHNSCNGSSSRAAAPKQQSVAAAKPAPAPPAQKAAAAAVEVDADNNEEDADNTAAADLGDQIELSGVAGGATVKEEDEEEEVQSAPAAAAAAKASAGDSSSKKADAAAADKLAEQLADTKVCQQYVLSPDDPQQAQKHKQECAELAAKLAKRVRDSAIECGICLEKVLSKTDMSARRFGLMACDHAFCLGCIRNWRATGEVDAKTALRTCPLCRTPTHFITPSTSWPESPADKAAVIDAYKASMAEKDCMHFDFGDGQCPFGTSCFYRHAYRDGRLEEVQLRRAGNADGDVKVIAPVTLSSFLEASLTAQLALNSSSSRRPARAQQRQRQQQRRRQQREQRQQQREEQREQQEEQEAGESSGHAVEEQAEEQRQQQNEQEQP